MSRLKQCFAGLAAQHRKGLIPFITAGDPDLETTVAILHALVLAGADVLELGVPFSDPMADGPVIQRASERALAQGVGLVDVLGVVRSFRQIDQTTPIVLMGYANPIERMGIERFIEAAQFSGVDGVLVVDYPAEEAAMFAQALRAKSIDPIFLIAPTTTDARIQTIAEQASGYVYYVSLKGVTGAAHLDAVTVQKRIAELRQYLDIPIGVGFGIRDAASARQLARGADAVVIGSRLIETLEDCSPEDAPAAAQAWLSDIRIALDQPYPPAEITA